MIQTEREREGKRKKTSQSFNSKRLWNLNNSSSNNNNEHFQKLQVKLIDKNKKSDAVPLLTSEMNKKTKTNG